MQYTLADFASRLGLELKGAAAPDTVVTGVHTLDQAGPSEVSFLANPKYAAQADQTRACAVIIDAANADRVPTALVSTNPYLDFARAVQLFARPQGCVEATPPQAFIHPEAQVADDAVIYPFAFVGARAVIGSGTKVFAGAYVGEDCHVGEDCLIYPNVTLMSRTMLGDRVIVHANAVLGSDGFGFAAGAAGMEKIPQIGNVEVGDDVEIGAGTTIDRAVLGTTSIGSGTKIDNQVQLGHNVRVGENCILVSQVGISGSTVLGKGVTMAGQVGVAGHLNIGDGATVGPKSGVAKDIPAGAVMGGIPAMSQRNFMRTLATAHKFPDAVRTVARLEKEIEQLKKLLDKGDRDDA